MGDLDVSARPGWMTSDRHPDLVPKRPRRRREGLSPDAARTLLQRKQLAVGTHPATLASLLDPEWGYTCRDCDHAVRVSTGSRWVWKCLRHRLGPSRSEASDIRISWPACALFRIDAPVEVRRG